MYAWTARHRAATPARANRFAKLEVRKDGARVDTIALGASACTVLGRRADICDYEMPHPSISRQHASLVHDKVGYVNVVDLGSAQGTFVNGAEIKPETPVALSGTSCHSIALLLLCMRERARAHFSLSLSLSLCMRWCSDGDEIRFGASTRVYVFQNPRDSSSSSSSKSASAIPDDALGSELPMSFGAASKAKRPPTSSSAADARKQVCACAMSLKRIVWLSAVLMRCDV